MIQHFSKCKTLALSLVSLLAVNTFSLQATESSLSLMSEAQTPNPSSVPASKHLQAANPSRTSTNNNMRNSWKPYFTRNSNFECIPNIFADLNIGVGFLYFDQARGGTPDPIFDNNIARSGEIQNPFVYNRTPLVEAIAGWNLAGVSQKLNFIGLGIGFLNQSNIYLQSYNVAKSLNANQPFRGIFTASINLSAVVAKLYFYLPFSMVWKTIAYSPYLAVSTGPSWQTWGEAQMHYQQTQGLALELTQKVSANCFFGSELGLKLRSIMPSVNLSVLLGCKFNIWGQTRNVGIASQQKTRGAGANTSVGKQYALNYPLSIKTVYQFAPFLGVDFAF